MELIKVGEKTYYIKNNTNIGVYKIDDENVYLIDSGNDKDAGKKILKLLDSVNLKVKGIINTHSNADHIGGNKVIQDRTGCVILAHEMEKCFTEFPLLEPSFLYGGYPFQALRNKFLMAKPSCVIELQNNLPKGLEYFSLKGHFFTMIGIKTSDDVYFLGDSIFSEDTLSKYSVFFLYDVKEYLNTLTFLETLKGKLFIPSHMDACNDIHPIILKNKEKIEEICTVLCNICEKGITFETILKEIFDTYQLEMNLNQYVLVGSTIKSYLSYLVDLDKIEYEIKDNQMLWKRSM